MSELIKERFLMKWSSTRKEIHTRKLRVQSSPVQSSPVQSLIACLDVTRHVIMAQFFENLNEPGIKVNSRNKRGLLGSSARDQISLQTFILNEIQPDRHCEQMASREGEKIGNVDLK